MSDDDNLTPATEHEVMILCFLLSFRFCFLLLPNSTFHAVEMCRQARTDMTVVNQQSWSLPPVRSKSTCTPLIKSSTSCANKQLQNTSLAGKMSGSRLQVTRVQDSQILRTWRPKTPKIPGASTLHKKTTTNLNLQFFTTLSLHVPIWQSTKQWHTNCQHSSHEQQLGRKWGQRVVSARFWQLGKQKTTSVTDTRFSYVVGSHTPPSLRSVRQAIQPMRVETSYSASYPDEKSATKTCSVII